MEREKKYGWGDKRQTETERKTEVEGGALWEVWNGFDCDRLLERQNVGRQAGSVCTRGC